MMTHFTYKRSLNRQHVQDAGPVRWLRVGVSACCAFVAQFVSNTHCPGVKRSVGGGRWDQQMLNKARFTATRMEQARGSK